MPNELQREIQQATAFRTLEAEVFVNVLRTSSALVEEELKTFNALLVKARTPRVIG